MPGATNIDALRDALAPVEALRGEQSQFEDSVQESFAALESFNAELTEWQAELARKQAELEEREATVDALEKADRIASQELTERTAELATASQQLAAAKADAATAEKALAAAWNDIRQLEEENAEQLQALGELERQHAGVSGELRALRKHAQELATMLEVERRRSLDEHRQVAGELKEMRRVLERQGDALEELVGVADQQAGHPPTIEITSQTSPEEVDDDDAEAVSARAAELRRKAGARRASRRSAV